MLTTIEMIFSNHPLHTHTEPPPFTAAESLTCLTIQSGNADCLVHFYPSLYQLTLIKADTEENLDLGFSGSRLLERLLQTPGEVVSREDLMNFAWSDRVVGQGSLNQQIYTLRQILGDEKEREIIQTLPRRGYMLNTKHLTVSSVQLTLAADTTKSKAQTNIATVNPTPPLCSSTPIPNTFKSKLRSTWMAIGRARLPVFTGACALAAITIMMIRESPNSAAAKTGLTLTYAPESASQMSQLVPLGETISRQLDGQTSEPLQLVLGAHADVITLICLRPDGSARSLRLHENQIATLNEADLAPCL